MSLIDVEKAVTVGKVVACVGGAMAVVLFLSACGGSSSKAPSKKRTTVGKRDPAVGEDLQKAIQGAVKSGLGYSIRNAKSGGRSIDMKSLDQYEVCFERSVPKMQAVMFYVVPVLEDCPQKVGR
ncbi:hypothetical protein GCM10010390_66720 [Streptomyces mordarskii]|uniref:Lipoprotein n=1 Tax=Streptomyces mordarskii TaxID=1226758 RepID=A0ABP3NWM7_9ACTN